MGQRDDSELKVGAKFWVALVGFAIGAAILGVVFFLIFGALWGALGFFGAFLLFGGIAVLLAWLSDRRAAKRRAGLPA